MKRVLILTIVLGIAMAFTSLLWAQSQAEQPDYGRGYNRPWSGTGPGWGMGPHMMGPGQGRGMGPGMMGGSWGMGPHHRAWSQMTPEQRRGQQADGAPGPMGRGKARFRKNTERV
jgi:hypothetical protein